MKKTYQIHLRIESEAIAKLKKQAEEKKITLAELCRLKIYNNEQVNKLDFLITKFEKLFENVTNK
ncbi:MAG: hypothetical protein AABX10_04875 [Nanoarchaeota archaeon]